MMVSTLSLLGLACTRQILSVNEQYRYQVVQVIPEQGTSQDRCTVELDVSDMAASDAKNPGVLYKRKEPRIDTVQIRGMKCTDANAIPRTFDSSVDMPKWAIAQALFEKKHSHASAPSAKELQDTAVQQIVQGMCPSFPNVAPVLASSAFRPLLKKGMGSFLFDVRSKVSGPFKISHEEGDAAESTWKAEPEKTYWKSGNKWVLSAVDHPYDIFAIGTVDKKLYLSFMPDAQPPFWCAEAQNIQPIAVVPAVVRKKDEAVQKVDFSPTLLSFRITKPVKTKQGKYQVTLVFASGDATRRIMPETLVLQAAQVAPILAFYKKKTFAELANITFDAPFGSSQQLWDYLLRYAHSQGVYHPPGETVVFSNVIDSLSKLQCPHLEKDVDSITLQTLFPVANVVSEKWFATHITQPLAAKGVQATAEKPLPSSKKVAFVLQKENKAIRVTLSGRLTENKTHLFSCHPATMNKRKSVQKTTSSKQK